MAIGKFVRYIMMTAALLYVPDGLWQRIGAWLAQLTG
jgi:hypothetical protein